MYVITSKESLQLGRAAGVKSLKPFPLVACRLLELVNDQTAHFRKVSQVLIADAAFSAQVLRVANSALLGVRFEITSILQAISAVGVDRLRALVVTVALNNYMSHDEDIYLRRCWRHNLATALWAEILAEYCNIERSLGYTAGMLHDIGRTALLMLFYKDFGTLMDDVATGDGVRLEAERRICDVDHCQIGGYLSDSWNFPQILGDVIAHHHDAVTPDAPRLRLLVQAACTAASMSGFRTTGLVRDWDPSRITDLLPPRSAGLLPRCDGLLEKVTLRFNETEGSLL